jgi:xylulokinase
MVWMDARARGQGDRLVQEKGPEFWRNRLGHSSIMFALASKLVWLREHEPQAYEDTELVLQPADYVIYRMTGRAVTDRSNACATGLYNLRTQHWDSEIASVMGISESILPELQDSGTVAGRLAPEPALELGLPAGTPVVLGAWDQVCAVVGAGSVSGRDALLSAGTAWVLLEPTEKLHLDALGRTWTVQHARPGQSVIMIAMSNGGAVVEWYRRVFVGVREDEEADTDSGEELSGLPAGVEQVPPGSAGVLVLPHLIGAMGIHMEPEHSACILGLRHGTGRAQIFRAILEAVAYEVRWSLQVLDELGIPTPALRMVGGATRSTIWPQIVADVTNREVLIPEQIESTVLGAARLAQEGVGLDVPPQSQSARVARRYQPQADAVSAYQAHYSVYQDAHVALKQVLADLEHLRQAGATGSS